MELFSKRELARQLRHQQTLAEQKMWWLLRSRAFAGHKFCRQVLIGPFIADFCCRKNRLIVELDGGQHADSKDYDEERTRFLEQKGYQVLRFWNREFLNDQVAVMEAIYSVLIILNEPSSGLRPPSPKLGEGKSSRSPALSRCGRGCPKGG